MRLWTGWKRPDRARDATRGCTVATVGTQRAGMTRSAHVGREDSARVHARRPQLIARRRPEVEEPVSVSAPPRHPRHRRVPESRDRLLQKPPLELNGRAPCRDKCLAHVETDFITTRPDGRPRGDNEIRRARGVSSRHRIDDHVGHARGHPPPADMRGPYGARPRIRQEQRHAIRALHGNRQGRVVGDENVPGPGFAPWTCLDDRITMHLSKTDQSAWRNAHRVRDVDPRRVVGRVSRPGTERPVGAS